MPRGIFCPILTGKAAVTMGGPCAFRMLVYPNGLGDSTQSWAMQRMSEVTHVGFADEANWNEGRYRAIALVTTTLAALSKLQDHIFRALSESGVTEFKFKKLRSARERFAAIKLIDLALAEACSSRLRVDVLIWDTRDSRHNVKRRDDVLNLEKMYYHLCKNVLRMRWPPESTWALYPDEHTAVDWDRLKCYVNAAAQVYVEGDGLGIVLRSEFGVERIEEKSSREEPALQLADLFAGLATFSRSHYDDVVMELDSRGEGDSTPRGRNKKTSNSLIERTSVIAHLVQECKRRKLGVGFRNSRGLCTRNPTKPINFWLYQPQHPLDKAPVKE